MGRVRGFILSHFSRHYFLIFLPFFSILSIVYIIRISILSNQISLTLGEFLTLFGFFLPDILFYTLPLSFIAALAVTLMRLSEDNELIALFSFGLTPGKLFRIFILPALLFTILMLLLSLTVIPQSTAEYKLFKSKKTAEAKLNITPNRLGQKFGDYIIFLGDQKNKTYHDVVLFATNNREKRVLIVADRGEMENNHSQFSLTLHQGSGDTFLTDRIESITYDKLRIYHYAQDAIKAEDLIQDWRNIDKNPNDMARFVYNIFLSFSPLLILGTIIAFSVINPRYQKSYTYIVSFGTVLAIYLVASLLKKEGTPFSLLAISALFLVVSLLLFTKKTKAHF